MLRAGVAAAIGSWAVLDALGTGEASAALSTPAPTARLSMVGDSLTLGTLPFQADAFAAVGWSHSTIDAYISRGVRTKVKADPYTGLTAVDAIRDKSGDTNAWVVALGTNDAVIYSREQQAEAIRMMMDRIGAGHKVLWVNVYLPDRLPLQQSWNASLAAAAAERTGSMFVYDWATFAAENQRWLSKDHLHYSRDGYRYRSTAVGLASRQLLPSLPDLQMSAWWKVMRSKGLPD